MPIPPVHEMLLPLLRRSADGREWTVAALRGTIADDFSLTDAERQELLPSNTQSRFGNRLCWAKIYLERAGLITRVRRGVFTISDAGRAVLAENPAAITLAYLDRFESFRKFREARTNADGTADAAGPQPAVETPDAVLEKAHEALNDEITPFRRRYASHTARRSDAPKTFANTSFICNGRLQPPTKQPHRWRSNP